MKTKSIALVMLLSLVSAVAVAADKKPVVRTAPSQSDFEGYGMAGCGLGSLVFKGRENDGVIQQVVAATLNGTGYQTFAISSGTSNCTPSMGPHHTAELFIIANREALEKDVSRGSGESIETLAKIFGCQDPAQFGTKLQSSYGTIFPGTEIKSEAVVQKIVTTVKSDAELSKACPKIG